MCCVAFLAMSGASAVVAEPAGRTSAASIYLSHVDSEGPRADLTSDTRRVTASPESFDELAEVASSDGTVRVIVTLRALWTPEQLLSEVDRAEQGVAIASLQQDVVEAVGAGSRIVHSYRFIPAVAFELDEAALARLQESDLAARVQLDELDRVTLAESVPLIDADQVWGLGYDGDGFSVAVLDTGVDGTHSFLSGKVIGEACFSLEGDCPNGLTEQYGAGAGVPCGFASQCAHGTHVAGIAAGDDSPALSGVAPGAGIVALQVFSNTAGPGAPGAAGSWASDQLAALEYAYSERDTYNIAAVNMSIGGTTGYSSACDWDVRKLAIDNLLGAGIPAVVAAGNSGYDNSVSSPGCVSTAVTVASSTKADARSGFSNWGPMADLVAPGSSILSSVPGGSYAFYNGTSMAAPHVAGAWALLKEAYPNAEVRNILAALRYSPTVVSSVGRDLPRVDIDDALALLGDPWPLNDAFEDAETLGLVATVSASTVRATTQSREPLSCVDPVDGVFDGITATIWYRLDPVYDTILTIDTAGSGFDTTLALYETSVVNPFSFPSLDYLTTVRCNDDFAAADQSQIVTAVGGGKTYWLQVGGRSVSGSLQLNVADAGDLSNAPMWPSATLTSSDVYTDRITVAWPAATDDFGVVGYRVYLDGDLKANTTSLAYTQAGLQPSTAYQFAVEAYDLGDHRAVGPSETFSTAVDFTDTDRSVFVRDIEWLSGAGITRGCNPPAGDMFCPGAYVTRGQMAAFLVRALGLTARDPSVGFVDDAGSVFEDDIEKLATAGITSGCNPPAGDMFCPEAYVTRGQMAAFLRRALG